MSPYASAAAGRQQGMESRLFKPTDEQLDAVAKFKTGRPLKITAFAGAGKTSTLKLLAESRSTRGSYLAFNKAIATEAKDKFPRSVDCRTTHSIAFREVMPRFGSPAKMTRSMQPKQLAAVADYRDANVGGRLRLTSVQQAHLILGTLKQFCQSADPAVRGEHVPQYGRLLGAPAEVVEGVRQRAAAEAARLWTRMTDAGDDMPLGHDGYLKLWALGQPRFAADYILLDEAQDTNAVVLGVLAAQAAQIVYVGDRHQQIYEWRGAVNAMEQVQGCEEAYLTQSFRFGPEIAAAAARVLATLEEKQPLRGNNHIESVIRSEGDTDTVLARTNAGVIQEVLDATDTGKRPHVVGGVTELRKLLGDVYELKKGKPGTCPEFFGFANWREVVDFAESEEGQGIRMFVQLVEQNGESKLWAAVKAVEEEEEDSDVIISTAHKAKGREWDSVRLSPDFAGSGGKNGIPPSEVRLFYVAMTRAKKRLVVAPQLLTLFGTDAWKEKRATEEKVRSARPQATTGSAQRTATTSRAVASQPAAPVHRPAPPRYTAPIERISPRVASQHPASGNPHTPLAPPPKPGLLQKIARFFGG